MKYPHLFTISLFASVCLLAAGCGNGDTTTVTRLHFQNDSGSTLSFLAIEPSEAGVDVAENRLQDPLEPNAVYSAVLSRPGNYWLRAKIETEGYVIERTEGPVRISRGVSDWQFTRVDARPLYAAVTGLEEREASRINYVRVEGP